MNRYKAGTFSQDTLLCSRVAFFSSKPEHDYFNPYLLLEKYILSSWTYTNFGLFITQKTTFGDLNPGNGNQYVGIPPRAVVS